MFEDKVEKIFQKVVKKNMRGGKKKVRSVQDTESVGMLVRSEKIKRKLLKNFLEPKNICF